MQRIGVNGQEIAFERAGSGAPLILIHSLGTASWLWEEQIGRWSARYDVLAPEARGHGKSSRNAPFAVESVAADIAALAQALDLGPAHVVAISMGGPIAAHLVALAPERVKSLVIADSFATQGEAGAKRADTIADTVAKIGIEAFGRQYAQETLAEDHEPALFDRLAKSIGGMAPEAYVEAARAAFTADVRDLMKAIRVPARVVVGARDQRTPLHLSQEIAGLIAGADLHTIEGARHLANLDRPDGFHAAVDPFLAAQA